MGNGLNVESIIGDAIDKSGIDDIGDEWFLTPLAAWSHDLESDNLTDSGRVFLRRLAVNDILRRLEVLQTIRQHPEILDVEIPPLVYITGLERSGTTVLHNLLALHPQLRPLLRWELMRPVPPPETATYETDERIAATQASIEPLRGSLLERMHWVNADEPEECTWAMIDMVGLLGQAAGACMPTWNRFLRTADMTPAFEHYRQVIQLLLWKHPVAPHGRLVLKAPQTSNNLAEFAAVFPEAHFVIPDRDPYRVLSSTMVMVASIVDGFCVDNPVRNPGSDGHDWIDTTAQRLSGIARFDAEQPDRVAHVPYPLLASDPQTAVSKVLGAVGLPVDDGHTLAVAAFIEAQRTGSRPTPPAHLDSMGLERDELMARPEIAGYCDRFAIAPEEQRLTGAAP